MMNKSYSELIKIKNYYDRFEYLNLHGLVGETTFNSKRYLNQRLYRSQAWKKIRNQVIIRDNGCDLASDGFYITDNAKAIVHHINPITIEDLINNNPIVYDLENLILVSHNTHQAIHYGNRSLLQVEFKERTEGDTKLW